MTPRIRAVVLSTYVEVARLVGLDPFAMLAEYRIAPRFLDQPESWMSAVPVIRLIEESARRSDRPDFAILMIERRTFASVGPVSLLFRHLANVREILVELRRFRRLISEVLVVDIEEEGDVATIRHHAQAERAGLQTIGFILAMVHRILTGATGGVWRPECVHFVHDRPSDVHSFERFFGSGIQFASTFNGFACPRQMLHTDNPHADAELAYHARKLLQLMPVLEGSDSVADGVRYAIIQMLGTRPVGIASISANLGMSARALQRSLDAEGETFASLLNECRRQRALQYLDATAQPMTEIAAALGYSGGSAFTRWFSHEFGETPAAWRARGREKIEMPPTWKVSAA